LENKIIGSRIILRAPLKIDYEIMVKWRNNPLIKKCFFDDSDISIKSHKRWIDIVLKDKNQVLWIIEDKNKQIPIGMTGLTINRKNFYVENSRLLIGNFEYRCKGYATEAELLRLNYSFNILKMNKVCAECLSDNTPILNFLYKMGFIKEGVLKKHIFKNNEFKDVVRFGFLAEDFKIKYNL